MATNQVINGKNRIVENPNRYKLNAVSGASNTYDFEKVPGVITENGTPYNKLILDKIDNVLSYLTPSVEKVEIITPTPFTKDSIIASSVDTTLSSGNRYEEIVSKYEKIGTSIIPQLKITNSTSFGTSIDGSALPYIIIYINGSKKYTKEDLLQLLQRKTKANNYYIEYATNSDYLYFTYNFDKTISGTFNYNINLGWGSGFIEGSNDNIIFTKIADLVSSSDKNIPFENYQYIRVSLTGAQSLTGGKGNINYLYFTNLTGQEIITSYQNQFTLDNNVGFTNNQRVLIETDKNVGEIERTITQNILPTNITPTWNAGVIGNTILTNLTSYNVAPTMAFDTNCENFQFASGLTNNIVSSIKINMETSYDSNSFLSVLQRTSASINDYNIFRIPQEKYLNINYDMKTRSKIKLKYCFGLNYGSVNAVGKIQGSNDNVSWQDLSDVNSTTSTNVTTFTSDDFYTYYRINFEPYENSGNSQIYMKLCYISEVIYKEESEIPYDVFSNTLNGIDIDTLLQPNSKYELIYKEDTNKFIFANTIYDIVLTQSVNQVDFTGIINKIEYGKMYCLIMYNENGDGKVVNDGSITCGNNAITSVANGFISYFFKRFQNNIILSGNTENKSFSWSLLLNNVNYEYIKCTNAGSTFNVGTHFIIKEVA